MEKLLWISSMLSLSCSRNGGNNNDAGGHSDADSDSDSDTDGDTYALARSVPTTNSSFGTGINWIVP